MSSTTTTPKAKTKASAKAAPKATPKTPPKLDAEQLGLLRACQEAKGKRDKALEAARARFSTDVTTANNDFAGVVDNARQRLKTSKIADVLGINRQNLHRILSLSEHQE